MLGLAYLMVSKHVACPPLKMTNLAFLIASCLSCGESHTWLSPQERQEAMRNAKFVIFSGGHATCFETIKYAKPSICVPTQPEQLGNAAKLKDLNCSITVKNRKQLERAVQKMEIEKETYFKNMQALNAFSNKFKGLDRAVSIVETLLLD